MQTHAARKTEEQDAAQNALVAILQKSDAHPVCGVSVIFLSGRRAGGMAKLAFAMQTNDAHPPYIMELDSDRHICYTTKDQLLAQKISYQKGEGPHVNPTAEA